MKSYVRECVERALKFDIDGPKTGRKSLSSTENIAGTLLDNRFMEMKFDTKVHCKKTGIVDTGS